MLDKDYFTEPERMAELIRNGIYHGRVSVLPGDLRRLKQSYPSLTGSSGELERDGICLCESHGIKYGLEIENYSDYGMPRRVLVYDACEYEKEAGEIRSRHERARDYKDFTERKSGMTGEEGYCPVITMVLYLGQGHFKGKSTLKECLKISEKMKNYASDKIQNYSFPLVEADYVNPLDYRTELRQFFRAMQSRYDKHKLAELFEEEAFQNITTETQKIIAVHLDVKELKKKVIEEDEDMCKAYRELVKDWKQEGRLEGRKEGRREGRQEGRLLDVQNLMDSLRLTAEQAMDALKIEGQEREDCYKIIGRS
ncbi:MAG: hypothetical protein ACI4EX_03915 [Lachnospiraceae bacterium]